MLEAQKHPRQPAGHGMGPMLIEDSSIYAYRCFGDLAFAFGITKLPCVLPFGDISFAFSITLLPIIATSHSFWATSATCSEALHADVSPQQEALPHVVQITTTVINGDLQQDSVVQLDSQTCRHDTCCSRSGLLWLVIQSHAFCLPLCSGFLLMMVRLPIITPLTCAASKEFVLSMFPVCPFSLILQ